MGFVQSLAGFVRTLGFGFQAVCPRLSAGEGGGGFISGIFHRGHHQTWTGWTEKCVVECLLQLLWALEWLATFQVKFLVRKLKYKASKIRKLKRSELDCCALQDQMVMIMLPNPCQLGTGTSLPQSLDNIDHLRLKGFKAFNFFFKCAPTHSEFSISSPELLKTP